MFQKFYLHSRHFNQFELWFYSKAKFSFCVLKWIIGSESAEIVALAVYKLSSLLWHTLSRSRRKCMTVHDFFRVHGMKSTSWNRPHRVSSSQYYEVHRTHCPTERRERKKFMKIELIFNSQQGVLSMIGAFSYSECKQPALAREKIRAHREAVHRKTAHNERHSISPSISPRQCLTRLWRPLTVSECACRVRIEKRNG